MLVCLDLLIICMKYRYSLVEWSLEKSSYLCARFWLYICRQSAWSCDILHIIAACSMCLTFTRFHALALLSDTSSWPSTTFSQYLSLLSDICHYNPLFSQQQAGGRQQVAKVWVVITFPLLLWVSCPVASDPAERKQQPSTVAVTVCSGV